jgi:hypothetical protein
MDSSPDPRIAVDLDPCKRPGVPMERLPHPEPGALSPIPPQQSGVRVFHSPMPGGVPPVFGTAQPPKWLSGRIRALAYRYPDHWARNWELLMLADRVDVWEHRGRKILRLGLIGAGVWLVVRRLSRRA